MYGNEGQNSINVTVSAPNVSNNSPSGSVNVYDGVPGPNTYLCTGYLGGSGPGQSGGNCYINNTQIDAGLYSLTATYSGDNNFAGSSSDPQDLSVRRSPVKCSSSRFPDTPFTAPRPATSSSPV